MASASLQKVDVIEEDESAIRFFLHGETPEEANALRRIMMGRVPTVAPLSFGVRENSGVLSSDVLAKRVGLIPFRVDPDALEDYDGGALTPQNSLRFSLNAAGGEAGSITRVVAGDLVWLREEGAERFAEDPSPACDDITITKLGPGHRLVGEVVCVKGVGADHAKWAATCASTFETAEVVEVRSGKTLRGALARRVAAYYPDGAFELVPASSTGEGDDAEADVEAVPTGATFYGCPALPAEWKKLLRNRYIEEGAPFRFYVETVGALSPRDIVRRGLRIWEEGKKKRGSRKRPPNRRLVRLPDGRLGLLAASGADGSLLVKPFGTTGPGVAVDADAAELL